MDTLTTSATTTPRHDAGASPIDQPARYPYQPALDGVRALAVSSVLLFHFGVAEVGGGFLGVDVFLALSGFLITTLLLRERAETGRVHVGAFYGRRARRLLPALFLVIAAVALFGRFAADELQLDNLRGDTFSSIFYFANWRFIGSGGGYFEQFVSPSPLRHLWSLAIEEQWYLLWPLVVVGLLGVLGLPSGRRRWAWVGLIAIGAVVSAGLMAVLVDDANVNRVYYGTDTRAQALLIGTTLAVLLHARVVGRRTQRRLDVMGLAGLVGCLVMFWRVDAGDTWMYRGGFALIAVFASMLIAGVAGPTHGVTRRILALPPLPALGRISYGVYLWHWPVFVYLDEYRTGLAGKSLFVVRCAVTLLVSIASYELVERPIREHAWRSWRGAVAALSAFAVVTALAGGLIPVRTSAAAPVEAATIQITGRPAGTRVLVAGDSVAFGLAFWYQQGLLGRHVSVANSTVLGCGLPFPGGVKCSRVFDRWRRSVERFDPAATVLMLGRWELVDRVINGRSYPIGAKRTETLLLRTLERGLGILAAKGGTVALLTVPPCFPGSNLPRRYEPAASEWLNAIFRKAAAAMDPSVQIVDYARFLCPLGADTKTGTVAMRADGVHFTEPGAASVWQWLATQPVIAHARADR